MQRRVRSRAVFYIGGYDPQVPEQFFRRLRRELDRFEALWSARCLLSPYSIAPDRSRASAVIETQGATWSCRTEFTVLLQDDVVLRDFAQPLLVRVACYAAAFADFLFTGTAMRMARHSWRFGAYFLYPALVLAGALVIGALAGVLAGRLSPAAPWSGFVVAATMLYLLLRLLAGRWFVFHLFDLWSFSRAYLRGRRKDVESRLDSFARHIVSRTQAEAFDEVLLVGHSTGGLLILDVAARCLRCDPEFSRRAGSVSLLTLASMAMKAGLHPAGRRTRESVAQLAGDPCLGWVDVQSRKDVINFFRTDPARSMGIVAPAKGPFPQVCEVSMRGTLLPEAYRRVRRNFFRIHYQFVFANTRPYFYDFFMICCGPTELSYRIRERLVGPSTAD